MTSYDKNEPAWFTHLVDQRLALVAEHMTGKTPEHTLIMTPLTEPAEGASPAEFEKWERRCDNCGRHCPAGGPRQFYTGSAVRTLKDGRQLVITFGVCDRCAWTPST